MTNGTSRSDRAESARTTQAGAARPGAAAELDRAVYTVAEAAKLLTLSRASTYAMVRAGRIPAMRVGARWVIPRQRFHAWLDELGERGGGRLDRTPGRTTEGEVTP